MPDKRAMIQFDGAIMMTSLISKAVALFVQLDDSDSLQDETVSIHEKSLLSVSSE